MEYRIKKSTTSKHAEKFKLHLKETKAPEQKKL